MTSTASGHLDRRKVARKGWFEKTKDDGKPAHKNYKTSCKNGKRGFLGPRHEAHHIIPQTAIEESIADSKKDQRYIADVQWITDWNINRPQNMIGLPTYHSYDQYYQGRARLVGPSGSDKAKELVDWFNSAFSLATRQRWLKAFVGGSPENYPIHNPVNWGHTAYNAKVKDDLKQLVWGPLNDKKKQHQLDAKTVEGELGNLETDWHDHLTGRGATNQTLWDRRLDPTDNGWHKPFTMWDVPNPLF